MKVLKLLAIGLIFTGAAFAQEPTKSAAPKAPAAKTITGTVSSVDAIGNTLIVKTKKAEDTLAVDSATTIKENGKDIKLADLAAGTNVSVTYKMVDGKKIATKVKKVAKAKAPAAAKPDTTKK